MSDYLPTELLIEILLKLPVKSLIRFTAVCKSWRSLITSPAFAFSHLTNRENQALLRRYDKHDKREHYSLFKLSENGPLCTNSSSELDFPFTSQIGYFRIVGFCDGLVCLSDDFFVNPSQPVIVWNPSVRNHVVLPKSCINPKEPYIVVLGFGVSNHVYKVVRLVYFRKPNDYGFAVPPQVEIFSLSTGRWSRLRGVDVRLRLLEFMWYQVFLNGIVHWLAYEPINDHNSRSSILTFEIGDEVFGEIMLPDELASEAATSLCLFMIGESLGVIKYDGEVRNQTCDVWMMKEYGVKESWTKLYRIDSVEGVEKLVGFWKTGEALLALQTLELVAYDPETIGTKNLGILGTPRSFYMDNYAESLILLRGRGGAVEEEVNGDALQGLTLDAACTIEN